MREDGKAATRVERGFDFGDQVVVRVAKTWQLSDGERGGEAHGPRCQQGRSLASWGPPRAGRAGLTQCAPSGRLAKCPRSACFKVLRFAV